MIERPALADPEIAAATFQRHLDELWNTGLPDRRGWRRIRIDDLHEVVEMLAVRADETVDEYYVYLGADYYDRWPPTAAFVIPETWGEAPEGSRWFPVIPNRPSWFGLSADAQFPDEYKPRKQLVCFSGTAQYYMVDHNPAETAIWRPGERTVAMTLSRLHELLHQPHYAQPSGGE